MRAIVLGGAGFVGSAVARHLAQNGWAVRVIDGLMPGTFADEFRLADVPEIDFLRADVTQCPELGELLRGADLIVDSLGCSRHAEAERHPRRDLALNVTSHLAVIEALGERPPKLLIQLGSRHQFGNAGGEIDDDAAFAPVDIQSIHKCAAEAHFRLWAQRTGTAVVALRLGNCFGPGQPSGEGDVGLIGCFARDLRAGQTVTLYGGERSRCVAYTPDIALLITRLAKTPVQGFMPCNYPGENVDIRELVRLLRNVIGTGAIMTRPMPKEMAFREVGARRFVGSRLKRLFPDFVPTPLARGLAETFGTPEIASVTLG